MIDAKQDALYDAVAEVTGLTGVWENQEGAVRKTGKHFSLKLLYPSTTWERKGNIININDRDYYLTRLRSTLQVKVFNDKDASDRVATMHNSVKFHQIINAGDVACWGLLNAQDISRVYTEYENVYVYDFDLAWSEVQLVQPDEESDITIERVIFDGSVGDVEEHMVIPEFIGVYASFATIVDIDTMTELPIIAYGSPIQLTFATEDGISKQRLLVPTAYGTLTEIQQYNNLIQDFQQIPIGTFTVTDTTIDDKEYKLYTHNGSVIGAREMKFIF